jgi:CubicO group peptidase (beta-lactamase class C family)
MSITALLSITLLTAPIAQVTMSPPNLGDGMAVRSAAQSGLDTARLSSLTAALRTDSFPRTNAVLVLHDAALVYEGYFRDGGRDVLNDTRSAMKSLTALAVGAAIADGFLRSVNEPVFARLADLEPFANDGPLKAAITIDDFLTMSSALDCDDNVPASPGNEENMYPKRRWARWAVDIPVKRDYRRDSSGRGPFAYCTAGTFLLGQLLGRTTGETVDRYVERRLLTPLGIVKREWPRSPSGEVMTGGGLRLRARDLAKLALMVGHRGIWGQRRVLPAEWIARVLTPHRSTGFGPEYGYLFWSRVARLPCGPVRLWFMSGNGGNNVVMAEELGAIVVVARTLYATPGMHQQTQRIVDEALASIPCRRR